MRIDVNSCRHAFISKHPALYADTHLYVQFNSLASYASLQSLGLQFYLKSSSDYFLLTLNSVSLYIVCFSLCKRIVPSLLCLCRIQAHTCAHLMNLVVRFDQGVCVSIPISF